MWACPWALETCLARALSYSGVCAALSGHASEMARATEGGGSSYDSVHQMADLKPSTAAPRGGRLHLGVFGQEESDGD